MSDQLQSPAHTESVPGTDPARAISVRGLTKRFGSFVAVDGIDFDVARGEIFGFLGPNGSGKTTTIRMLTGTIAPQAGSIEILGDDVIAHPEQVKRRIGYMSQKFFLFEDMTVDENLRFYAGVYGLPAEKFADSAPTYSRWRTGRPRERAAPDLLRVEAAAGLGSATIHEPELLFLDEPTSGVDPVARRHFWDLLYESPARGVTLFVTTHYMDEAAQCGRLAFMYAGRLIAEGTPQRDPPGVRARLRGLLGEERAARGRPPSRTCSCTW